jgi:hypothetical protein
MTQCRGHLCPTWHTADELRMRIHQCTCAETYMKKIRIQGPNAPSEFTTCGVSSFFFVVKEARARDSTAATHRSQFENAEVSWLTFYRNCRFYEANALSVTCTCVSFSGEFFFPGSIIRNAPLALITRSHYQPSRMSSTYLWMKRKNVVNMHAGVSACGERGYFVDAPPCSANERACARGRESINTLRSQAQRKLRSTKFLPHVTGNTRIGVRKTDFFKFF